MKYIVIPLLKLIAYTWSIAMIVLGTILGVVCSIAVGLWHLNFKKGLEGFWPVDEYIDRFYGNPWPRIIGPYPGVPSEYRYKNFYYYMLGIKPEAMY